MTREEAIEILRSGAGIWPMTGRANNALNMAIKALEQEPKTNIALERYKDLQDFFSDEDTAKTILENQTEFKAWLERLRWNTKMVDILARKLDTLENAIKTIKEDAGHWIYTGDYITEGMLKCSKCGFEHDVSEKFYYCPNCGHRMESEEIEE